MKLSKYWDINLGVIMGYLIMAYRRGTGGELMWGGYVTDIIVGINSSSYLNFGRGVGIESLGNRIVVGSGGDKGYVYEKGAGWPGVGVELLPSDGGSGIKFGYPGVSISEGGDVVVFGAYRQDVDGAVDAGVVYVYRLVNGVYVEERLVASDYAAYDRFGYNVSITRDGSRIAVGAPNEDVDGNTMGCVYIFSYVNGEYVEDQKLYVGDRVNYDYFGYDVKWSGDGSRLWVGSPQADTNGNVDSGGGYLFENSGGLWVQVQKFNGNVGGDYMGNSVAINYDGSVIVAGAPYADKVSGDNAGSVMVLEEVNGAWITRGWSSSMPVSGGNFGNDVAVNGSGNIIVVGESGADKVYVYVRNSVTGDWEKKVVLQSSSGQTGLNFGYQVDITEKGDVVVVGSPREDINGVVDGGAVYVFTATS